MALLARPRELPAPCPDLAVRYPRLAAYLDALPARLDSYPECQARGRIAAEFLSGVVAAPDAPEPPPEARFLLTVPASMWIPEVRLAATAIAILDYTGEIEDDLVAWAKERNAAMFRGIVYRSLMAFMSPAALVEKGASRWESFHRGTTLTLLSKAEREAVVRLAFPPHLFSGVLPRVYGAAMEAALEHSRARNPALAIDDAGATWVVYRARWE